MRRVRRLARYALLVIGAASGVLPCGARAVEQSAAVVAPAGPAVTVTTAAWAGARQQYLSRARELERRGDWHGLLLLARDWTAREPADALAWFVLGRALGARRLQGEAIAAYREAVRLDPDDVHALINLGNLYRQSGRPLEALGAYRAAVARNVGFEPAWHNLGIVYFDVKGAPGVMQALQRLHHEDPALAQAWRALALDYARARDERIARSAVALLRGLSEQRRNRLFDLLLAD